MHRVNKIVLDLNCRDKLQAGQLVSHWTPHLTEVFEAVLLELCGQIDDPAKVLLIDRLELYIGDLTDGSFSGKLEQLKTSLREALNRQAGSLSPHSLQIPPAAAWQPEVEFLPESAHQQEPDGANSSTLPRMPAALHSAEAPKAVSLAERSEASLFYFLQHGNLPWWQSVSTFSVDVILTDLLSASPARLVEKLASILQKQAYVAERLVSHCRESTLELVFETLGLKFENLNQFAENFFPKKKKATDAGTPAAPARIAEILHHALVLVVEKNTPASELAAAIKKQLRVEKDSSGEKAGTANKTEGHTTDDPTKGASKKPAKATLQDLPSDDSGKKTEAPARQPFEQWESPAEQSVKYLTEQAGLILTAGYLPHYFSQLGLRDAQGFVSDQAQAQAVYALNYLATGQNYQPEYALPLEKILCGIEPETFLPAAEPIDPAVLEAESQDLLSSLLAQWSVLKTTSVDGLCQTFLNRKGMLERLSDSEWALHVESGAFDVLLHAFPAGLPLSTIVFSWSKSLLYVNWERP
ncbi:MAG: hypothetical protein KDD14_19915 [Saprospiraceae bacterium]|nr:hypothetical protein [Saprospiraceae bacterium]